MTEAAPAIRERRRVHRVAFQAKAMLYCGAQSMAVEVLDLSLKGALIAAPKTHVPLNTDCQLLMALDEIVQIRFTAHIARQTEREWGLQITELDLESIQHLRRLVELNLGDPDLLSRDLAALFQGG